MARAGFTKLQMLDHRHPGLADKMETMFAESWPDREVMHMIAAQFGERVGLRTVARYKKDHWQAQRELVERMSENIGPDGHLAIGSSNHRFIGSSEEQKPGQSSDESPGLSMNR